MPQTGVLEPLNGEDDPKREDCKDGSPDSEVAEPDVGVLDDLDGELYNDVGDDEGEGGLYDIIVSILKNSGRSMTNS
jgi:hypothetical protein